MSDAQQALPPTEPVSPPSAAEAKPRTTPRFAWSGTALVIAVAALAVVAWNWWDSRQQIAHLRHELATRLAEADDRVKESQSGAKQALDTTQQLQIKLGLVEGKLAESQNQQVALEALYQELSRNQDEWSLSEIEQILGIANQQLQLAGNVSAALVALQAADSRLQRLDKPQLAGLRRVIDQDIQRLKAVPFVDTVGIAVKLDNLIAAVDVMKEMPLMQESPPSAQPSPPPAPARWSLDGLGEALWRQLKDVIRIERLDVPAAPLLSPTQSYFLRQNLKLRLLSARLALLARDEASYRSDLKAAREWLGHYFDSKSRGVVNATATLRQLEESAISIAMPDIGASLEAVRQLRLPREGRSP